MRLIAWLMGPLPTRAQEGFNRLGLALAGLMIFVGVLFCLDHIYSSTRDSLIMTGYAFVLAVIFVALMRTIGWIVAGFLTKR